MNKSWIDISVFLKSGMVHWPCDSGFSPLQMDKLRGTLCEVSILSMGPHSGTHMNAPAGSFKPATGSAGRLLNAIIGRTRVIEIFDRDSVKPEELSRHKIQPGERILFKTYNSDRSWKLNHYCREHTFLTYEAALELARLKVRTVGIDYLAIGDDVTGNRTAQELLEAGTWIIEGLDLSKIEPGIYNLMCLPLKMLQDEGAPARAMLQWIDKAHSDPKPQPSGILPGIKPLRHSRD